MCDPVTYLLEFVLCFSGGILPHFADRFALIAVSISGVTYGFFWFDFFDDF